MLMLCFCVVFSFKLIEAAEPTATCRSRSNHFRQDFGLCFEIPPWQHKPVVLQDHIDQLKDRFLNSSRRQLNGSHIDLSNSELTRYMDTVLAPFLDTYHRNIQNSYQQLTGKILRRIKEDINTAVQVKQEIYKELTDLANELKVPEMCQEERRASRTLASRHVALIYACTEEARYSIAKMGNYAEQMISITRKHMQTTMEDVSRLFDNRHRSMPKSNVDTCITELSRAAVVLGYELDLSLTNARRHNEQSCERLTVCSSKIRKRTQEMVQDLREQLYQCVYA